MYITSFECIPRRYISYDYICYSRVRSDFQYRANIVCWVFENLSLKWKKCDFSLNCRTHRTTWRAGQHSRLRRSKAGWVTFQIPLLDMLEIFWVKNTDFLVIQSLMESLVFHHIVWPGLDLWFISLRLWTFDNSQGNSQGANRVATPGGKSN